MDGRGWHSFLVWLHERLLALTAAGVPAFRLTDGRLRDRLVPRAGQDQALTRSASRMTRFWATALGYQIGPPPQGFAAWNDYYRSIGVAEHGST
jgi:hypothetical protein